MGRWANKDVISRDCNRNLGASRFFLLITNSIRLSPAQILSADGRDAVIYTVYSPDSWEHFEVYEGYPSELL